MRLDESSFTVNFEIRGGTLHCYRRKSVEMIRPWGTEAGAWQSYDSITWQAYCPELQIDRVEELVLGMERARPLLPCRKRQVEAFRFLLDSWPECAKECARPFASSHWELLQLINRWGELAKQLLGSNPALGFLVAMAANPSDDGPTNDSLEDIHQLLAGRRRKIAGRFGFPETEGAVRLLGKVPAGWVSTDLLAILREVLLEGGEAAAILAHLPRINPALLSIVSDPELRGLFSFQCLRQVGRIGPLVSHCDILARVEILVESARRHHTRLPHFDRLGDLDRGPRPLVAPKAVQVERKRNAFWRPPVAESPHIHAIRTPADLRAEGTRMRHCAGAYVRKVAKGSLFFYHMLRPERATICIRRRIDGWRLQEVRGEGNGAVQDSTLTLIKNWLRDNHAPGAFRQPAT